MPAAARPKISTYIDPTPANAERALAAIRNFFDGTDLGIRREDLTNPDAIVQLGVAPVRIDLLSAVAGISKFRLAWQRRVLGKFGSVDAHYLSLEDLIKDKESLRRDQDKADLASLRRAKARRK